MNCLKNNWGVGSWFVLEGNQVGEYNVIRVKGKITCDVSSAIRDGGGPEF